jgi:hypothetical protein
LKAIELPLIRARWKWFPRPEFDRISEKKIKIAFFDCFHSHCWFVAQKTASNRGGLGPLGSNNNHPV